MSGTVKRLTGMSPIDDTRPNDVFVCGYPKSGNTWVQHLAAAVCFGVDVHVAPDEIINDVVPDVHFKQYYRRYAPTCVFKTHHLPLPSYRRIVYLIRDGRDAMVSYYHHLAAMSGSADLGRIVRTGEGLFPGKWHEHVNHYLANPFGAEMIVVRYEDLKRDTAKELRRFCAFAGVDRDDATIAWAVERASFDNMRAKEQKVGWETPGWPKDKRFVRRGAVGSFRDEMPPDVLAAFVEQAGRTLSEQGYV
jgi:hypothetical protein